MYIAAAMISILFDVSDGIRVENCMPSISTLKPASLPISLIRSTITPSMVLVLVSRKVKGMPVGVEPTFSTWSSARAPDNARLARMTAANVLNDMKSPLLSANGKKSGTRREATQRESGSAGVSYHEASWGELGATCPPKLLRREGGSAV